VNAASIVTQAAAFNSSPNSVWNPSNGVAAVGYWNTNTDGNGGDSRASQVIIPTTLTVSAIAYTFCRLTGVGTTLGALTGYFVSVDFVSHLVMLGKFNGGTETDLSTALGPAFSTAEKYRVFCECVGTTLKSRIQRISDSKWLDNTNTFQAAQQDFQTTTDVSISGAGKAGIGFFRTGATDVFSSDDFLFETVGAGTGVSMKHPRLISLGGNRMSIS
jgi:hypothetical protein